ncbi:MAG: DMT family transporter [Minisyncoccia bacterium]
MPWYFYAFLTAITISLVSIIEKKVLIKVHSTSFSATLAVLNFVFSLPFIFIIDFSKINKFSLAIILLSAFFASLTFLFIAKAMRKMEISTISPILALNPGVSALAALVFLGERLSLKDTFGIVLMIIGSYVLMLAANHGFKHHIKAFFRNKETVLVLLTLVFYAAGSVIDRFLVAGIKMDPLAYLFFVHMFIAVIFVFEASQWGKGIKGMNEALHIAGAEITVASLLTVAYRYFELVAFQSAFIGLVSSIKRSSSFFTTIIGGEMFHEDKLVMKSIASVLIILGCLSVVL